MDNTLKLNVKPVLSKEHITFQCQRCAGCCRHVEDSIMLDPIDIYRVGQYLREHGEQIESPEDVISRYAHPAWLEENFPMLLLNTTGTPTMQVCVFLKAGRCSIYEARPTVCRLYPFSLAPGVRGGGFQYYLCMDKSHHFTDGNVSVKDWFRQNLSKEVRAALRMDHEAIPAIGQAVRQLSESAFQKLLFQFLYYRYYNYDLDQPFLPQFQKNLAALKQLLGIQEARQ